jgi:hypothetical protein
MSKKPRRLSLDESLRVFGFVIAERPKCGPAVWVHQGKRYTEQEAWQWCQQKIKSVEKN